MSKGILLWFLPLIITMVSCEPQQIESTKTTEELDTKLTTIFDNSDLTGLSIVTFNDSGVLYQKSFGLATLSTQQLYTNQTVQTIGSVSKTVIALAIMKAKELGKLQLNDPINLYLPFKVHHPSYPDTPITINHLVQHTSGIDDEASYLKAYVLSNPEADYAYLPDDIREYIEVIKNNEPLLNEAYLKKVLSANGLWYTEESFKNSTPGTAYNYSNIGASLAALVIEKATGIPFDEFTKYYIFTPLQMEKTSWERNESHRNLFATRYFPGGVPAPDYQLITYPDGGLITSTSDFGKFLIEMLMGARGKGTLLSATSYKEMFTQHKTDGMGTGVFWEVSDEGVLSHTGSDIGILSLAAINPNRNAGAFLMTNIGAEDDQELIERITAIWNTLKRHDWNNN